MIRIVDLFCGAGGESTGIIQALGDSRYDLAAVNHWKVAIETHQRNHPQARHFQSDLQVLNPLEVFGATDRLDLLWASPECTHHSVARGGRPRSDQGRASAWLILKWLSELYCRRVILENVPEFVNWGPLGADGKPLKSQKGKTFQAFVAALQALGYKVEWQMLCAADYGDPTTRTRFFLQAVRGRGRIEWPAPSHDERANLFGRLPWVPARDIIDWSIKGESIISRRRPLAPATLRRIEAGIRRYWGEWAEPFLVMLTHGGRTHDINAPLPTVTCAHRGEIGVVEPFLVPFYGERLGQDPRTHSVGKPVPTIPASGGGKFGVVEPFILPPLGFYRQNRARSADEPMQTITSRGGGYLVQPFLLHQMSWGGCRPVDEPVPTVVGQGTHHLIEPFLVRYNGTGGAEPVRVPLGALTTRDRFGLVEGQPVTLDITFRMLHPHELARAQGFPADYWFAGNRGEQVMQIGNAVPVGTAKALTMAALVA